MNLHGILRMKTIASLYQLLTLTGCFVASAPVSRRSLPGLLFNTNTLVPNIPNYAFEQPIHIEKSQPELKVFSGFLPNHPGKPPIEENDRQPIYDNDGNKDIIHMPQEPENNIEEMDSRIYFKDDNVVTDKNPELTSSSSYSIPDYTTGMTDEYETTTSYDDLAPRIGASDALTASLLGK